MPRSARDPLAWLGLSLVRGLGAAQALELARLAGGPRQVLTAPAAAGLEAAAVAEALREAEVETARLAAAGATLITWGDGGYPARLRTIADPPLVLAVRGTLGGDEVGVAVVGARRASPYGQRVAAELAAGLADAGLTVVSGLAAGIDAAAHRAALAAGGRTLAVLGTGIDRVYPAWHAALAGEIARRGALISELRCGAPPLAHHFPQRNRLISGLTVGTVVVEAACGSGSLITARCALDQGREVFAVPGPVGSPQHCGSHRLIQQGAKLVTGVEDVLEEIAPTLRERVAAARAARARAVLAPVERRVLEAVGGEEGHVDDVIRRAGLPAGTTLETLLALELRGLVEQQPGKRFRLRAA
ncbi:MAG TPA: DNA-processing protein DprA [Candidatus Binatia bacterium]|nr:DNA-processing protein DprA [Candidatus Binatia bacterium]